MNQMNTSYKNYSTIQLVTLVVLRFIIGWHILYEGILKLFTSNWTSANFLNESQWIMSGIAHWIVSNSAILNAVNFLNVWGLIAIGTGLILGLFTRTAAIAGTLLIFVYYLNNVPIIGIEYSVPTEGSYLIVSKTLIEAVALFAIAVFPTGKIIGIDALIARFTNRKK
jgi:thiosulfate dehydrogenase [quinone] large subunit